MPIPQSKTLMSQLLELLANRKSGTARALAQSLAKKWKMGTKDQKRIEAGVEDALQDLKEGKFVSSGKGGAWKISKLGLERVEEEEEELILAEEADEE